MTTNDGIHIISPLDSPQGRAGRSRKTRVWCDAFAVDARVRMI